MEFNNSHRPGGGDGTMNIETGVFTAVTSGHYIITTSGIVQVRGAGHSTVMWLYHNGVQVEESRFVTRMFVGDSQDYIDDHSSRTVVGLSSLLLLPIIAKLIILTQILHLLAGDTLDLRTEENSDGIYYISFCLYMAPAPYGL